MSYGASLGDWILSVGPTPQFRAANDDGRTMIHTSQSTLAVLDVSPSLPRAEMIANAVLMQHAKALAETLRSVVADYEIRCGKREMRAGASVLARHVDLPLAGAARQLLSKIEREIEALSRTG